VARALLLAMLPVVWQCSMQFEVCDLAQLHNFFSCAQTLKMQLLKSVLSQFSYYSVFLDTVTKLLYNKLSIISCCVRDISLVWAGWMD
jgi:hypothetical protein